MRSGLRARSSRWVGLFTSALVAVGILPAVTWSAAATTAPSAVVRHATVDPALRHAAGPTKVIVQRTAGTGRAAEAAVRALGGVVTRELSIVHGFAATVPGSSIRALASARGVRVITADTAMHVQAVPATADPVLNNLPSVYRQVVGADKLTSAGANGHGVTVALIDTGVAPLPDLSGRIVSVTTDPLGLVHDSCMNFSSEPGCADSYGHGTFIAGLIAGNGTSNSKYAGTAPGANILSVKLAGASGTADVSQTLAAIQWVVSFRSTYNIKVLNLSLGTDSTQSYRVDPLNYAVEQAWKAGIAVVVAASNRGPGAQTISKPGDDPFVITVGASDDAGTKTLTDDAIPSFSSHGPTAADGLAKPDLIAPGTHLVSLAAPGSTISTQFPSSMDAPYRRGSGTSFANGVVAGVVADMLSANPTLSPNRIKFALMSTARAYPGADVMAQGAGVPDGFAALYSAPPGLANQGIAWGDGSGSLELSRGTVHVDLIAADGSVTTVQGDTTASLSVFDPLSFLGTTWTSLSWWTSQWAGQNWTGQNWTGQNWTGQNWTGQWTGQNWTGQNWTGQNWTGQNWTGQNWTGQNWTGSAWYGAWDQ